MPATSELSFCNLSGREVASPLEWERYRIVLPIAAEDWEQAELTVQGARIDVVLSQIDGAPAAIADWERRNAGNWLCILRVSGNETMRKNVVVNPRKLDTQSFEQMLVDIDEQLIGSILFSLETLGAFAGEKGRPPNPSTAAEELQRVERAVLGDANGPGFAEALLRIGTDPHKILHSEPIWVRSEAARAPVADRLALAYAAPENARAQMLDPDAGLERVWDARVEHTFDVYENRILKTFVNDLVVRVRRLAARLNDENERLQRVQEKLETASRAADFLVEVGSLRSAPRKPSMVLMKRIDYQIAYRRWLEYRKFSSLSILCDARSAPLENTPLLYEIWGSLLAVGVLLQGAIDSGWHIARQDLFVIRDGWCVDLAWSGRPIIVLENRDTGASINVLPQHSFTSRGRLRSISLTQRPDLVIELERPGYQPSLIVLDPKYKLRADTLAQSMSEELDEEDRELTAQGKPVKSDIDKMHAYRDAIRDEHGCHAITHAAIIYPGHENTDYAGEVGAIGARPGKTGSAKFYLKELFETILITNA